MGFDDADVLVVGAGSAGAAAAGWFAKQGRRVVLVDKRPMGETGARWLNAVPKWCFDEAEIARPSGDETPLGDEQHTFHLVSPGRRDTIAMHDVPMLHVDMRKLVGRLVEGAVAAGVRFARGHVDALEMDGDRVSAVVFGDGGDAPSRFTIRARLVVDASGLGAAVRRRVEPLSRSCPEVGPEDLCAAAEFQHDVADREALRRLLARHGAAPGDDIAFSGVAGGYSTLTLFTREDLAQVGVLTGSIPGIGVASGLDLYNAFVERAPWLGPKRFGGAGAIPLRRPYAELGAHGVALVGDAACQVYSSHGSGVGMGLLAARALARAAERESDPGSDAVLSRYGALFFKAHGGLLAASDAFRRFVQGATQADLDGVMQSGLLDPTMARDALLQRPARPGASFAMRAPARALKARGAALRFIPVAARSLLADKFGSFVASDRFLEPLLGRAARSAPASNWSLPDLT